MKRYAMRAGAFLLLSCSTPLAGQRSDRRVIDAADIAAAGWHHLGDVASALPPGAVASVDGFNHELSGSRLGFIEAGGARVMWTVRLNGQPVPTSVGGLWILDAIPVAITQLDSVVINDGPRLADGRVAFIGTIDLYTRQPRAGASLVADYQHGDESGDPGPYRYTARATPNVEKLGPFASGAAAFATEHSSIDLAGRYSSLNITDQRIASRIPNFGALQSDVNASGGSGIVTFDAGGGRHFVLGGRGRFTGLMRVPTLASEQSARVVTSQGGVSGALVIRGSEWRYSASAIQLEVEPLGSAIPLTIEQDRLIADAFVEAPVNGWLRLGAGSNFGRQKNVTQTSQRRSDRLWVAYARRGESAVVAAERSLSSARVSGSARHERVLGNSDRVAVTATALSSWADGEGMWMEGTGTSTTHAGTTTAADLRIEISTRELMRLRPTWYARGFTYSGMTPADRSYGIGAGFVASTARPDRRRAWARGEITQFLGEAAPGESATPGGFIEGNASTPAPGNFLLAISARYAPATQWPQLELNAPADVPATQSLGFSVNKPMWNDRVRAQLVMRNVLNAADRSHPLGAQWNLRTHLAVTVVLP